MELLEYNDTGFVYFPRGEQQGERVLNSGKTFVYLVCSNEINELNTTTIPNPGTYSGNNMLSGIIDHRNIDNAIRQMINGDVDPLLNSDICSITLLGWSNFSYFYRNGNGGWRCDFDNLTEKGREIYYLYKKLYQDSDIRIITFNNIK